MDTLSREALYELVWSEPMLKVADRFQVSSSYMARVCSDLNVPRPERGYWAKLAVGKAPTRPSLPEAKVGDPVEWRRDGAPPRINRGNPDPKVRRQRRPAIGPRPAIHALVAGAKAMFESGRLSHDIEYLKPTKKLLVDLLVSKPSLERALAFANELFLALELAGHHVLIASYSEPFHRPEVDVRENQKGGNAHWGMWKPGRPTVAYVNGVAIGLTVIETTEYVASRYVGGKYIRESEYTPPKRGRYTTDHTWTSQTHFATGRLGLNAYSPHSRVAWDKQWREQAAGDLITSIPAIVKALEHATPELVRLMEAAARQAQAEREAWEAQQERWRQEAAERRAKEARKESIEGLHAAIKSWAERRRIEDFFQDVTDAASKMEPDRRDKLLERIQLARDLIGDAHASDVFAAWMTPEERLEPDD